MAEVTMFAQHKLPLSVVDARAAEHSSRPLDSFELHNKTKAISAAANAVRPRSAITGLGEYAGSDAVQQLGRRRSDLGASHDHQQLSTRPHIGESSVTRGLRDILPQDMQQKSARFCVGCRGRHQPSKVRNEDWQPYTPLQRFERLGLLESAFQTALRQGKLPCALAGANAPILWLGVTAQGKAMKPINLGEQQYKQLLPVLFEGVREGHEPYRYLASQAAIELLAVAAGPPTSAQCRLHSSGAAKSSQVPQVDWILEVLPQVVAAVKAGLNTMQPSLAAHMLCMLQRLLQAHSCIGPALVPCYKQLLPAMTLLVRHSKRSKAGLSKRLLLPPPCCVPAVGSFTGDQPPAGSGTCCTVCGASFGSAKMQHQQQRCNTSSTAAHPQVAICGHPAPLQPCNAPPFGGEIPAVHTMATYKQRRATMWEVVEETLQLMVEVAGSPGLAVVKKYWPAYDYCNPQD